MDLLYGHDRKLDYLDETDMVDFLDSNMFHNPVAGFPTPEEECYENDWLTSFLDDPVLNDKMMTDAMQPPCIKSEHSYSINDQGTETPGSPLGLAKCEDLDNDFFGSSSALDLTIKSTSSSHHKSADAIISTDAFLTSTTSSPISMSSTMSSSSLSYPSSNSHSSLLSSISNTSSTFSSTTTIVDSETVAATNSIIDVQQPTIIVTATPSSLSSSSSSMIGNTYLSSDLSLSAIQIKQEPLEQAMEQAGLESITLPPTPPGSSGSDSEGSQSPQRSAPSSPVRYTSSSLRHHHHHHHHHSSPLSPNKPYAQPLFVNPISQSGVLLLSEEEKRTLISEGYPIPTKLPLTKQEEKNLKKIRRKIKNKISAQESRRKKKEYLEALEKRVEAYNHENSDLKKKVESLENSNRSLLGQLQKLQSLVKMPKASQTGTALMVLVFCFAIFLGSMSPSLNIGYATKPARLGFVPHHNQQQSESRRNFYGPEMGPMMMTAHDTSDHYDNDPYVTPNLKSRMLMSVDQDEYCNDFKAMPWDSAPLCPNVGHGNKGLDNEETAEEAIKPGIDLMGGAELPDQLKTQPDTTVIMVMAGMENNSNSQDEQLTTAVLPDVTINTKDIIGRDHRINGNFTAELETA